MAFDVVGAREVARESSGLYVTAHQGRYCAETLSQACDRIEGLDSELRDLIEACRLVLKNWRPRRGIRQDVMAALNTRAETAALRLTASAPTLPP